MICKLTLKNFKCFQEMELEFSAVNILTGLNGMGKSSILQSLLLLKQSQRSITAEKELLLRGEFVNVGVGQDLLFEKAESDEMGISIETEDGKEEIELEYLPEEDALPVKTNGREKEMLPVRRTLEALYYLSAYRIEPQILYQIENETELADRYFSKNGEYAIQYLKLFGEENVKNPMMAAGDGSSGKTINSQVKRWMDIISPGVSPVININPSTRSAELKYEYIEGRNKTNSYKSVNVGFGITYVLPVVVTLVSAAPGDVILIENPEAHIHPKGQRMLGELMALAGAGGVQMIIETHSDHVLNGIRVAVKKGKLSAEKAGVFCFYKDFADDYRHKVKKLRLDANGRFDEWPEGFFDEWDNALLELL